MRKLSSFILAGSFLAAAGGLVGTSMAQSVSYVSGAYTQNFDTLATSGLTNAWSNGTTLNGWYSVFGPASTSNTTRDTSTTLATQYAASTGSSTAGGLWSFGIAGVNPVTDRALGSLGSASWEGVYAVVIQNNTGTDITNFTLTYDGEQWRNGQPSPAANHSLIFDYTVLSGLPGLSDLNAANVTGYTAVPALNFTGPIANATAAGALDGNAAANRIAGITSNVVAAVPSGQYLILRWWDNNDASNDHALGIDNVSFSAATPTPGAIGLLGLGGLVVLRRKR